MVKLPLRAPTIYIVREVIGTMEPKTNDSSRRGFFSGLTEGPFKAGGVAARQQQDGPRHVSRMQPQPDYGESSYKGSGRLFGRKALITGGTAGMGRAAAIAFAREGADVAFNYLPMEQADADEVVELIREAGRQAVPLPGDLPDED